MYLRRSRPEFRTDVPCISTERRNGLYSKQNTTSFPSNMLESASTALDLPEELRLAPWRQGHGHSEADGLVMHEEVTVERRVRVVSRIAPTTQLPAVRGLALQDCNPPREKPKMSLGS